MHLLLRFCLACSFILGFSARKPGTCPPDKGGIGLAVCRWDCVSDYGCPGAQKCCSYGGCVNICRTPTPTRRLNRRPCTCACVRAPCDCCPEDGDGFPLYRPRG